VSFSSSTSSQTYGSPHFTNTTLRDPWVAKPAFTLLFFEQFTSTREVR
jgi:hypothetical protein